MRIWLNINIKTHYHELNFDMSTIILEPVSKIKQNEKEELIERLSYLPSLTYSLLSFKRLKCLLKLKNLDTCSEEDASCD